MGVLVGLNWAAAGERMDALGLAGEARTRVVDFLGAIEAGALAADAERRREQGEGER
ncbi:MAG TPA: hypothetical protein VEA80_06540 [Vitreimonas sp.]|uniref:hypothetical protein n=1 Tax=Vitreimonas sp. TaxID=3069702 RepID=UPI002D42729E|nr:hypothetical protein [Vitreimonas sp.]HYD87111.1 hypothetical protein [Vitreimonas sp.]